MKNPLSGLEKFSDLGLLVMRIVIGLTFVHFGWFKLLGGQQAWQGTGSAISSLGIDFGHLYWGLAATFAELLGGLFLVIGLLTRPAALLLFLTMIVATALKLKGYNPGDLNSAIGLYYPLSMAAATFGLLMLGAGKFSLEGKGGGSKGSSSESKPKK
jgi:putative oxidoreductase